MKEGRINKNRKVMKPRRAQMESGKRRKGGSRPKPVMLGFYKPGEGRVG